MAGRPQFQPTPELSERVERCVSGCMTHENIARAIGISKPTLEKHFASELSGGAARKHALALDLLWRSAEKGNVTAQKKLVEITTVAAATSAEGKPPAKVFVLGKKEAAIAAARAATEDTSGEWGSDLRFEGSEAVN